MKFQSAEKSSLDLLRARLVRDPPVARSLSRSIQVILRVLVRRAPLPRRAPSGRQLRPEAHAPSRSARVVAALPGVHIHRRNLGSNRLGSRRRGGWSRRRGGNHRVGSRRGGWSRRRIDDWDGGDRLGRGGGGGGGRGAVERDEREASARGGHEPQPRLPGLSHLLVVLQVIHEVGYDALEQLLRAVRALRLLLTSLTLLTGLTLTLRLALLHEPLQHLQHLGRRVVDRSLLPLTLTLRLALALGVTTDG